MTSNITAPTLKPNKIALGLILCIYIIFGSYTHLIFLNTHPAYDFRFYERALARALSDLDPYDVREIGPAFLYPPPALFVIEAFDLSSNATARFYLVLVINLSVMLLILRAIYTHFGYQVRDVWFWFPLTFFFAPFLATLHLGQINLITEFGIVLFFVAAAPWLAALGLVLAGITKVTPVAFLFYSLVRRDWKTILYTVLFLAVVIVAAGLRYGFSTYATYGDVFSDLLQVIGLTQNSQSFEAKVWMVFQPDFSATQFHRLFLLYMGALVLFSGYFAAKTGDAVPLFVILGMVIAVSPNVMWYHHYVFLLPPLLTWMTWDRLDMKTILWVMTGLLIIQVDYYFLTTGFLIHLFVQFSILRVIYQQYSKLREARLLTGATTV